MRRWIALVSMLLVVGCGSDSTKPETVVVTLTSPNDGAVVVGTIEILATAENADRVRFFIDQSELGSDDSSPYLMSWNSTTSTNGSHVVRVRAEGGGSQAEDVATVVVNNAGGGIAVVVAPATANVSLGATQQFTATVTGTNNTAVTWTVEGGAAFGSVSNAGLYSAPGTLPNPASATVRATSVADPTKSGTALVTLTGGSGIAVTVSPATIQLQIGQAHHFTATVTGAGNTAVTWSVDGGGSFGTITGAGHYTTPVALPTPASATVRATSVADPSKSGTAQVTLTSAGLPAEERKFIQEIFSTGFNTTESATGSIGALAQLVFTASEQNGNNLTLTGTLTETPPGSLTYVYTSTPTDRLVIIFHIGSVPVTVEATIQNFEGDLSDDWQTFRDYHTNLRFRIVYPGAFDVQIQSASGAPPDPSAQPSTEGDRPLLGVRVFERSIVGTVLHDGEVVNVDLTHQGQVTFEVDGSFADYENQEQVTGTATSPSGQLQVNEGYYGHIIVSDIVVENYRRGNQTSGTRNGVTFQFQNVLVQREFTENAVAQADFWIAEGSLLRNGAPFGTVRFEGPVIKGTRGPRTVLELVGGEIIPF